MIGEAEARTRLERQDEETMNFVIFCDERREGDGALVCRTVVDPTAVGNIGRYANHSCDPSMAMVPVR